MGRFLGKRQHQRPKRIFITPGRECMHADAGCCPDCLKGRPRARLLGTDKLVKVGNQRTGFWIPLDQYLIA